MVRYLLVAAMVMGAGWTQLQAQEISLVSLTDHKTILLGQSVQTEPVEIKLASPVAAEMLIGIAVGGVVLLVAAIVGIVCCCKKCKGGKGPGA